MYWFRRVKDAPVALVRTDLSKKHVLWFRCCHGAGVYRAESNSGHHMNKCVNDKGRSVTEQVFFIPAIELDYFQKATDMRDFPAVKL